MLTPVWGTEHQKWRQTSPEAPGARGLEIQARPRFHFDVATRRAQPPASTGDAPLPDAPLCVGHGVSSLSELDQSPILLSCCCEETRQAQGPSGHKPQAEGTGPWPRVPRPRGRLHAVASRKPIAAAALQRTLNTPLVCCLKRPLGSHSLHLQLHRNLCESTLSHFSLILSLLTTAPPFGKNDICYLFFKNPGYKAMSASRAASCPAVDLSRGPMAGP